MARPDRPEVLGRRERDDALPRHADLLPELDRDLVGAEPELRIAGMHGRPDAIPVESHVLADELRGELDRSFLEVLPEREVAEHLEEREVRPVEADLVDVRRPKALLHGHGQRRRRILPAEEVRHLGLHTGGREECGMVICARDQRRRRHPQVALALEERLEALAKLGRRSHHEILEALFAQDRISLTRSRSRGKGRFAAAPPSTSYGAGGAVGSAPCAAEILVELALPPC